MTAAVLRSGLSRTIARLLPLARSGRLWRPSDDCGSKRDDVSVMYKPPARHPFASEAEKTFYALRMARLGGWLVSVSGDDYRMRVLGMAVLIHLRAYLDHAPQLKNKLRAAGVKVAACETALSRLRHDFDRDYTQVRDKLGAHRQDVDLVERLELWNSIEQVSTTLLVDDASEAWEAMVASSTTLPTLTDLPAVDSAPIAAGFAVSTRAVAVGEEFTADNLGYAQAGAFSPVLIPGMQERLGQVISVIRFGAEVCAMSTISGDRDVQRILRGLFIVSGLNLLENLFPTVPVSQPAHVPETLMALDADGQPAPADALRRAEAKLDRGLITRLVSARGHIAAHIDQRQSLRTSVTELDHLQMNDVSELLRAPWEAVGEACSLVPALDTFWKLEGMGTSGYARFEPRETVSPFEVS